MHGFDDVVEQLVLVGFQYGGVGRGGGKVFLLVKLFFHLVEGVDVGFFKLGGFGAGEAHGQEDEAVAGDGTFAF